MKTETKRSWIWLLALFTVASFVETLFWGQVSAFTPLFLPMLGVASADVARWTGLIAAVASLVGIPFLPLWGALADRYSRQPLIVRSFVVHAIAGTLAVLASNVWFFLVARAVMNLSYGNTGLMMTTLSERAPAQRQGLAFAVVNSAGPVGVFLGPLLGGPVVDHWGIRTLLAINAALMLLVVLLLSVGYKDHYHGKPGGRILPMAIDSVLVIVRSPRLRILFSALFLLCSGWMLVYTYVPLTVLALYRGTNQGLAVGLVMGAAGAASLVLGPLVGVLADRYGHWRTVFAGSALLVVLWPLPALMPGLVSFGTAWSLINGLASGVFAITFSVLSTSAAADIRGRVMSFSYLPINIGSVLGPALGSILAKWSIFAIFPATALLTAASIPVFYAARRTPETA